MEESNPQQTLSNQLPTPDQVEKVMIEKELAAANEPDPLDTHATLFSLFTPRFENTVNMFSKKQAIRLMTTLSGSVHNPKDDVNKISKLSNTLNLKGILRVLCAGIEFPLENKNMDNLKAGMEEKLFELFNGLLTNKYMNDIKIANERLHEKPDLMLQVEDVITHVHNLTEFNKRDLKEKDAFAIGNKLLASKFLMMYETSRKELVRLETLKAQTEFVHGEENVGTEEKK